MDLVCKDRHLFNVAFLCNICPQEFFNVLVGHLLRCSIN